MKNNDKQQSSYISPSYEVFLQKGDCLVNRVSGSLHRNIRTLRTQSEMYSAFYLITPIIQFSCLKNWLCSTHYRNFVELTLNRVLICESSQMKLISKLVISY